MEVCVQLDGRGRVRKGVRGGLGTQEAGEFVLMDEVLDMLKFGQVVHGAAIYGGVEVNHIWWCLLFQVMDVHGCPVELLLGTPGG